MTTTVRLSLITDVQWQSRAQCQGVSSFDFIPFQETPAELIRARQWCDLCPVRSECLDYALLYRLEGFWGGTSTKQRCQIRAMKIRIKCPNCTSHDVVPLDDHQLCLACGLSWAVRPKQHLSAVE